MDRVISTLIGVAAAIVGSGIIFIGANKLFDVAPRRWSWFTSLVGGLGAALVFGILLGNRVFQGSVWILVAAMIGAVVGFVLGSLEDRLARIAVGAAGGAVLGLIVGMTMRRVILVFVDGNVQTQVGTPIPNLNYGVLTVWTLAAVAVGAVVWLLRGRRNPLIRGLVIWGTVGWAIGAFGVPDLNTASRFDAVLASTVLGTGIGASIGFGSLPGALEKRKIEEGSRKYIFLTPALFFIAASLVVPTIRTLWLSFLDGRGVEAVGLANYTSIFTDANIINVSNWTNIFTSRLFIGGMIVIALGFVAARLTGRSRGEAVAFGPGSLAPLTFGVFLIAFAVFTTLRGTIINNLWWVFAVTGLATILGLAVAVLADKSRSENIAKSLIFMPMAISFVGAGIIWRFMYIARPPQREQTGVLNSLWVWLGQISNSTNGKLIAVTVLAIVIVGLAALGMAGYRQGVNGMAIGSVIAGLPLLWLIYRFLGPGLGGFAVVEATGETISQPIQFTSEGPFNNFWLMIVLIWIQTGFAMVIFSAAIKAVPGELLEAARVDGATESQSFWGVTIPQIAPTIGVVVTTLIVTVMKVFDIVRVMTAGNFDTNVIANEMYDKAFAEFNFGVGSALAMVLFLSILPIMFYNIRRMQKLAV
ncbi:MAG: sugar ABC transporter permease [Acidimicrobiia bacterium]|nr:sugar ABC transporter permease [Acidimicrobiia bacterium]